MSFSASDISESKEYRHLLSLPYSDVLPFVIEYIKKRSAITIIAYLIVVAGAIILLRYRISLINSYSFIDILPFSLGGLILFPLLLVFPHEFLHILPYYVFGARKIRIGYNLRDFYFYVSAHMFPVTAGRFAIIALCPLVLVSAFIIYLLLLINNPLWDWSLMLCLFVHFSMTAGDIALINFYWLKRGERIITWDDANEKMAYFYARVKKQKIDR